jgi:serine/threonine protein kinase
MRDSWQPGDGIGPFRLERLIGQGAVGQVWLAHDPRLGRAVAIKVISSPGAGDAAAERFGREARVLAQLSHPSIVQVLDVGRERNYRYIVTEFIDGLDLGALISKGAVRVGWAVRIAGQVAEAIKRAHELGIVHRDIKPSNILIDARYDRAKVSDFGLAKGAETLATITSAGTIVGTPAYMAPEQLEGHSSPASDIYSLGATLYHLFTGSLPRDVRNIVSLVRDVAADRPREPRQVRPDIPDKLSNIIMRMLEPDPSKRLASIDELQQVLAELEGQFAPPEGQTIEERAIEASAERAAPPSITQIAEESAPGGFFDASVFSKSKFFGDDSVRFLKIQETLNFYCSHLNEEYQSLLRQANLTYRLWLGCVGLGFLVLLGGVGAMLLGRIQEGAAAAASTILVYFIQRVFQQREDHYRSLATSKNSHLEYGNHWLLVIQSIDSIEDDNERAKRQSRLVDVLTEKLGAPKESPGAA